MPSAPFCCSVAASAKKNAATSARISATSGAYAGLSDARNGVETHDLVDELEPLRPVRDEEHRALARRVEHVCDERLGRRAVEVSRRLVDEKHGCVREERSRDDEALSLAARELRRPPRPRACRARPATTRPSRSAARDRAQLAARRPSLRDERASGSRGSSSRRRAPPGPRARTCDARPPAGGRADRLRRS